MKQKSQFLRAYGICKPFKDKSSAEIDISICKLNLSTKKEQHFQRCSFLFNYSIDNKKTEN